MKRIKRTLAIVVLLIIAISASAWPWLSPYSYCMNNPVKFVDPDGRKVVNSKGVNIFYINSNNQLCYSNIASSNEKMVFNGMMLTNIGKKC